jgi:hypothetical protein
MKRYFILFILFAVVVNSAFSNKRKNKHAKPYKYTSYDSLHGIKVQRVEGQDTIVEFVFPHDSSYHSK